MPSTSHGEDEPANGIRARATTGDGRLRRRDNRMPNLPHAELDQGGYDPGSDQASDRGGDGRTIASLLWNGNDNEQSFQN